MPWLEVAFAGRAGEAVPRADDLAVIATEHPVADQRAQIFGDRAFQFDGQVRNAAPGVQHIGADEGIGRANVQARSAASAMFGAVRWIDWQRQIDKEFAEEEVTAG